MYITIVDFQVQGISNALIVAYLIEEVNNTKIRTDSQNLILDQAIKYIL